MIFRRLVVSLAAAVALIASILVTVSALTFALFSLLEPAVGAAGAGAIMTLVSASPLFLVALILGRRLDPKAPRARSEKGHSPSVSSGLYSLVRDRPILTSSMALGVGLVAMLNPRYLGIAARAFLESRPKAQ